MSTPSPRIRSTSIYKLARSTSPDIWQAWDRVIGRIIEPEPRASARATLWGFTPPEPAHDHLHSTRSESHLRRLVTRPTKTDAQSHPLPACQPIVAVDRIGPP